VDVVVEIAKSKLTVCPSTSVSDDGIGDELGPSAILGSTLLLRLIVAAKPPMLSTPITETASTPGFTHKLDGVDERTKSAIWAWTRGPRANPQAMIMIRIAKFADIGSLPFCIFFFGKAWA